MEHSLDVQVALGDLMSKLYIRCHKVTRFLIAFLIAFSKNLKLAGGKKNPKGKQFKGKIYSVLLERSGERQPLSQSFFPAPPSIQGKGPENEVRRKDEVKDG